MIVRVADQQLGDSSNMDTSVSFSTDLGLSSLSSGPKGLYLKYAVDGSSDTPEFDRKYFNEFKNVDTDSDGNPRNVSIHLDDGGKEVSYDPESQCSHFNL